MAMATTTALVAAAAISAAATVYSAKQQSKASKRSAEIAAHPEAPEREDASVAKAGEKQRLAELQRKGRRATILTSGQGVADDLGAANIARPTARSAQLGNGSAP